MAKGPGTQVSLPEFFRVSLKVPGTSRKFFGEAKKRRLKVPREPRIYIEKALYLVTARGHEDRDLFNDPEDYYAYLKLLNESKGEYGFRLFAYALMPKSLCLLIELKNDVTISTIMHNLSSKYTKTYNSRYGKKGHLFRSRFKSTLIEKDEYLLRLTRYIHCLPDDSGLLDQLADYPYSSYPSYLSSTPSSYEGCSLPDVRSEANEVFTSLNKDEFGDCIPEAYERYVLSADQTEIDSVQKLLHRKAFVGSKEFIRKVEEKIEEHCKEDEPIVVTGRTNRVFALTGTLMIIFLGIMANNFYKNQSSLQNTLNLTANGYEAVRADLTGKVRLLTTELTQKTALEKDIKETHGLAGGVWEVQLTPVTEERPGETFVDRLSFKGNELVSSGLQDRGFSSFQYSVSPQTHGKVIWQTAQTNKDGLTVNWYGVMAGGKMRGILSERPLQGQKRDFSFVSVRRVTNGS